MVASRRCDAPSVGDGSGGCMAGGLPGPGARAAPAAVDVQHVIRVDRHQHNIVEQLQHDGILDRDGQLLDHLDDRRIDQWKHHPW